jgi:ABC-type polysaccharide/polyol phosphate transport system ATPase subunit
MAGLSPATSGTVTARGRVAPLLELGAGFHPLASGRENAYINGLFLGLSKQEIRARLPEIIAFAGLEDFADRPVRTYSWGMTLRLSFSVAVHVRPDILVVDEVLAVGDADFREKCYRHFESLRKEGVTVVFVSHDFATVERLSDRAVLLEKGRVALEGAPKTVIERYVTVLAEQSPAFRKSFLEALGMTEADVALASSRQERR